MLRTTYFDVCFLILWRNTRIKKVWMAMAFVGGYHKYVKIKRGDNGIYQRPEMTKRSVNYYSTKVRGRKTHVMATPTMPICFKAAWAWQRSPSVTIWKGRLMSKSGTQGNKLRLTPSFIHLMLGIVPIVIFNSKKFRFDGFDVSLRTDSLNEVS